MSVVSTLILASMLLAACGGGAPQTIVVTSPPQIIERTSAPQIVERTSVVEVTAAPVPSNLKILRQNFGAGDVPTIDPAVSTDTSSVTVVEEAFVGLTRQNEETGAIEPGMAESWDISEDGKTYTFHLVKGVPWVKYNPGTKAVEKVMDADGNERVVTAKDFEYGILRTLDPATASDYAYVLTTIIQGSVEFNSGDITDTATVGVKAIDDNTLEVKINEAASYAPAILGLWVASAQPQWQIEERGDRWIETGFFTSYGPWTLKTWNHESDLTLIKNPFWPGLPTVPQPKIDEVFFTMLDESAAFANYEAGDLDSTGVPLTEIDRVKADPELSKQLKIAPNLATYYYGFNVKKAPFDNPKVRLAFSEAVDRQSLIDNVTKGGQEPAQWFARPGLAAAPTMETNPDLGVKYNPEDAKALLAEAYPDVSKMPPITLMVNQVEGHVKIAEAIVNMWKTNLGVDVQLQQQEWKVFLETLQTDAPQIYRLGWSQDYPDANNFLKEVFHSGSAQNNTGWTNPKFDELVDQAALETDEAKRRELYAQAEDILVKQDAAIIPLYWYTTVAVTQPWVQRTYSVGGHQHYEKWDLLPRNQ
jgi:oligopeptide transport system substrate-binding protein